jgi:hypothetical protein
MPKTRSKRAADTVEPAPAEPAKKRQSKRAKKVPTPELEPPEEPPIPAAPVPVPEPESEPAKEEVEESPVVAPDLSNDIPVDGDEAEQDYVEDALKEEPRASDLYLDTVGISQRYPPYFAKLNSWLLLTTDQQSRARL